MTMHQPKLRCAVYTRKSTEEGLDQEFNSLDAQREACSAFIASQVGLGWKLVPDHYDDGGISGGTMERPALQRLLQDIRDRKVDVVVVYKIDRLTRSLTDFSRIVEVFDASNASFVSVTQQFNTTTSMGRLTLNVLLSFAQFEREVTAERIRDKIAASKKKGMWMGGTVPLGYEVCDRKLIIKQPEADFVRRLFERYIDLRSVPAVVAEINRKAAIAAAAADHDDGTGVATRSYTRRMHSGMVYKLLANPLYIGKLRHRDNVYDGEHDAVIDIALFDRVQSLLATKATVRRGSSIQADSHLLTGILYDDTGDRMSPTHARKQDMRYRYYISSRLCPAHRKPGDGWRLPAKEIEGVVLIFASQMLEDRSELAGWIEQHASSHYIHRGLATAGILKVTLADAASADRKRSLLRMMFQRITLSATTITFAVDVASLVRVLIQGEVPPAEIAEESSVATNDQAAIITITLPLQMKRRGNEARIIVESGISQARAPDSSLVHLIARAHIYLAAITERSGTTLVDVAERYSVHQADVGRILPLAFLSPTITDAILSGRQPIALSARQLARLELPAMWTDQMTAIPA
jgi:DNA invertase Pin-like site-specific DNA recombinase